MKVLILIILELLVIKHCTGQMFFIGNTRHEIKRKLGSYIKKNNYPATITETESSLLYLFRDSATQNLDYYFHFSERGRCEREIATQCCDSCFQKFKQALLGSSILKKVQVNDSLYYGYYPLNHMMEIRTRANFVLEAATSNVSRKAFQEMKKRLTENRETEKQ